ncbi:MAG TPA: hypothetical protein VFF24_07330 [Acidimicrobiia bacterium]|nr:hypothetical protein [Acidimicrobiia bacterium]
MRHLALVTLAVLLPPAVFAQPVGRSRATPYAESSAGRAWQRITFGAIDCGENLSEAGSFCPNDAFTQQGIFGNGTYKDLRFQYTGAPLGTAGVAENLGNRVLNQSQTFPAVSSASGFTFSWKGGATPARDSEIFGPLFGERGRTNGRGQLSATLTVQQLKWETLDGFDVRDISATPEGAIGAAGLPWGDPAYLVTPGFEAGYVGRCEMNIDTSTISVAANYGITDRLDLAVAVPFVRTTVEGSNEFLDFVRFPDGSYSVDPLDTAFFPQGRFFVKGSSTGLGDVAVQATFAIVKKASAAVAIQGRVDLGTGDLQKMTGTGETHGGGGLIASYDSGLVSPHASVHYFAGNTALFDELRYTAGLDFNAIRDRLTLSGEVVGRRLYDVEGFQQGAVRGVVVSPLSGDSFEIKDFAATRDDFNLFFFTAGGKLRLAGQLLGSAYVLVPFGDNGLQAQKPTFNFGFNYAF